MKAYKTYEYLKNRVKSLRDILEYTKKERDECLEMMEEIREDKK